MPWSEQSQILRTWRYAEFNNILSKANSGQGVEGAYSVAQVHLRGLDVVMKKRGGYLAFEDNINVARAVNW